MLNIQEKKMPFMGKRNIIGSKELKQIEENKLKIRADKQAVKLMQLSNKQELKDLIADINKTNKDPIKVVEEFEKRFIYTTPLNNCYKVDNDQKTLIISSLILALSYGAFGEDTENEIVNKILLQTLDFRNSFNKKNNIKFLLGLRFTNFFIDIISKFLGEDIEKEVSPILLILMLQNKHSLLLSRKINLDSKMFNDMALELNCIEKDRTLEVEQKTVELYNKLNNSFKSYCDFDADRFKMIEKDKKYSFVRV